MGVLLFYNGIPYVAVILGFGNHGVAFGNIASVAVMGDGGIKVDKVEKSNSWFKSMEEYVKSLGGVLGYIKVNEDMTFKSSLDKFLTDEERKNIIQNMLNENMDKNKISNILGIECT